VENAFQGKCGGHGIRVGVDEQEPALFPGKLFREFFQAVDMADIGHDRLQFKALLL
jgi:hypothetical protein